MTACGVRTTPTPSSTPSREIVGNVSGTTDADGGSEPVAACTDKGGCPADRPYCDMSSNRCVECLQDGACDASRPRCEPTLHHCVECATEADCMPGAPFCDAATHACAQCLSLLHCMDATAPACHSGRCGACTSNDDCDHIPSRPFCDLAAGKTEGQCVECQSHSDCKDLGKPQCTNHVCSPCSGKTADDACQGRRGTTVCNTAPGPQSGACVQCTADDEAACGDSACDVHKHACSKQRRGTAAACETCVGDSACLRDYRCIELNYANRAHGTYCLKRRATGCLEPYSLMLLASSISGSPDENYCGIDVRTTTCEAVIDALHNKMCTTDNECGAMMGDGLCRQVGNLENRCTYPCASSAQCASVYDCNTEGFCQ